jgi:hypothetical protein
MGNTAWGVHREMNMPWTETEPMKERMRFVADAAQGR